MLIVDKKQLSTVANNVIFDNTLQKQKIGCITLGLYKYQVLQGE